MLKKCIKLIFSHLPILAVTDDNTFLYNDQNNYGHYEPRYRFSVISIIYGETIRQFLTVKLYEIDGKKDNRFQLYRKQKLSEMEQFHLQDEKVRQLEEDYKRHLVSIIKEDCNVEKETLLRKIGCEESRINLSYNKINVYLSVVLVIIPLLVATIDYKSLLNAGLFIKITVALLVYSLINICAFVFQSIKVGKYPYSAFRDLKESNNKVTEQLWQIYYDWQQTRRKADMFVSFVLNLQEWVEITIGVFVIVIFFIVFNVTPKAIIPSNQVYTISIDSINDSYSDSAYTWHNLLSEINSDAFGEIIVLYNSNEIDEVYNILNGFNHQKVTWVIDEKMDKNELKIIMEK